jgi:hypothetical protein
MAQQSSTVATFRAFVMLTCVLLIPLAAVCGTSFPSVVKAIQNGRWPTPADFRGPGENAKNGLSEAPRFVPASAQYSPTSTRAANLAPSPPQPVVSVRPFSRANVADSSVVPISYEAPVANLPGQSTTFPQNKNPENRDFGTVGNRPLAQPHPALENRVAARSGVAPTGVGIDILPPSADTSQVLANESSNPDAKFRRNLLSA